MSDAAARRGGADPPGGLGREVAIVFAVQILLVVGLVQLDRLVSLDGALHAFVGLVFVFLPVIVLDRRGRPYRRYGITLGKPLADLPLLLIAMVVCFVPIAIAAPPFWREAFGETFGDWSLSWPEGYPGVALSHLVVVALPEELFYRGYLMGRLDDIFGGRIRLLGARVGWSLPMQAALFALGHFLIDFNPSRLGVFFPALAFGWMRARRGTIVAPVLFHAASNVFMEILRAGYGLS
ncbi:MAG: CPBP family intramembrane glutamic endopeptidase [Polyangia bacterium]